MKYGKQKLANYAFQPQSRLGQELEKKLSWQVNRFGRRTQMIDQEGFVFDLDKQGRIVKMKDSSGQVFKCR